MLLRHRSARRQRTRERRRRAPPASWSRFLFPYTKEEGGVACVVRFGALFLRGPCVVGVDVASPLASTLIMGEREGVLLRGAAAANGCRESREGRRRRPGESSRKCRRSFEERRRSRAVTRKMEGEK